MIKDVKYLVISDIHLGHKKTKTEFIINNLNDYFDGFTNKSKFVNLDLIFISGDLFDGLLDFSNIEVHEIILWITKLINFCNVNDIYLRILEGTPSHDWKQSKIFNTISKIYKSKTNVRYIESLYIEHIKKLDLYILYIPDEWSPSPEETFIQVKALLSDHNLKQVDIAMMHGCFNYQVGDIPNIQSHNEDSYLNVVKYYITIGHFHNHTSFKNIIAPGSFDRVSHNDETVKGGVICTIGDNINWRFVSNKNAKIYKTIKLQGKNIESIYKNLCKKVDVYPKESHIRIHSNKGDIINVVLDKIKKDYPFNHFTKKEINNIKEINVIVDKYIPMMITPDNIEELLFKRIRSYNFNDKLLNIYKNILKDVKQCLN